MRPNYLNYVERFIPLKIIKYLRKNFTNLVLSYSGGTDSTLLLLYMLRYEIPPDYVVFTNTRMEYVETFRYIKLIKQHVWPDIIQIRPKERRKELLQLIKEDWDKVRACDSPHDKHNFRCCEIAKKHPFRIWLKNQDLYNEQLVAIIGTRAAEGYRRAQNLLRLFEYNHVVYSPPNRYKYAKSWPVGLLSDRVKLKLLVRLTQKFHVPMPPNTGCGKCPIFYRFVKEDSDRWRENAAFFANQTTLEPFIPETSEVGREA